MSELQLGLLLISAVIVVAVLVYNKIEQLRLRRRTETAFGAPQADVLLDAAPLAMNVADGPLESALVADYSERIEHTLGEAETYIAAEEFSAAPLAQPITSATVGGTSARSGAAPVLPSAALDSRIDFIVALDLPRAYPGSRIASQAEAVLEPTLSKPIHWEGYDGEQQRWVPVQPQHSYAQLRAGLQLANRAGPIAEEELIAFVVGMQELALALSGQIEAAEVSEAIQHALAIDNFCADHDIQIGLSVLGREGNTLPGTKIRALAESQGCALAKDGRYYKLGEQGELLYALSNTEPMPFHGETLKSLSTRGVALTLDVPRAPGTPATFRAYIEFARQLTQALDGVLVDDERKAIGDTAIDQIAQQLNAIHQAMAARGIPAGGAIALRLFA